MRRSGFTMVELIFVIIIIGILSAAAIPKFGDIKDRSKINSENAALSALDGAIIGAIEFQQEDYDNMAVAWHEEGTAAVATYGTINTNKEVLQKILKKGDALKIVAYGDLDSAGAATDGNTAYDMLFIEGTASNKSNGVKKEIDIAGKPDKNDFWVFNTSPVDMNITGTAGTFATTMVESGEMKLIDSNTTVTYTGITYVSSDGTTLTTAASPIEP